METCEFHSPGAWPHFGIFEYPEFAAVTIKRLDFGVPFSNLTLNNEINMVDVYINGNI